MRPYLRAANVTWQGICLDDVKEMNFDDIDFEKFRLASGDILLNEASGSPHEVGKPAIWNNQIEDCCFQNTLLRLRPRLLNRNYLHWYCYASALAGRFGEAGRGVNIRHLGKRGLAQFPIPIAPLAEQERIVTAIEEHLSRLAAASDAITTAQTRIEASRRSVLTEAFAGQLAPQDPSDETASALLERIAADRGTEPAARVGHGGPTDLPLGWTWARLDDLAAAEPRAITDGPFGSNLKTAHYTESGPRVIRLQNIGDGVFRHEDAHVSEEHYLSLVRHAVQEDDLVVASLGETLPRACLVPGWVPPAIVKADCIRVRLHPEVNSSYVNFALQHPGLRRQTATEIKGVGRPRLGLKGIRNLAVPLAPPAEQQRVVAAIEKHYARLDATSQAIVAAQTKIEAVRRCILSEAVTGRLVPQDPDDEPATVLLDRIAASRPLNANRRKVTA